MTSGTVAAMFGTKCDECGGKIDGNGYPGTINGRSVVFCSYSCLVAGDANSR